MEERHRLVFGSYTGGKVFAYTRGYILDEEQNILWMSIFGGATALKTLTAQLLGGAAAEIRSPGGYPKAFQRGNGSLRCLAQSAGDVAHKILFQPDVLTPWKSELAQRKILTFGSTLDQAKSRLFAITDRLLSTPLTPKWTQWVWDVAEELDIEIFAPGLDSFHVCRLVELPEDLEGRLLDDLGSGLLSLH